MNEFANPLPVRIILVFRGNPNRTVEDARAAQNALVQLTEFFRKAVAGRRRNKGNDLISLLIDIEEEGEVLTEEELYAQCIALLFAGHKTTRNLIGNGMYTLLRNTEQAAELREHPEMIRSAVEELLRYESPVQFTARVLKEDIEVCGQPIRKVGVLRAWIEKHGVPRTLYTDWKNVYKRKATSGEQLRGEVVKRMEAYGVRSYIPEKKPKGRRKWAGKAEEQQAVYAN